MAQPVFITIEGVDGAGKSTHVDRIVQQMRDAGLDVVQTREPGGTPMGEVIREEILGQHMQMSTQVVLAFASRALHMEQVIRPALSAGKAVFSDRFTDSTYAYQGAGAGADLAEIERLEQLVHGDLQPTLTLFFDLTVEQARQRLDMTEKTPDQFEGQDDAYFERVRKGYLDRAAACPERFRIIDSSRPLPEVREQVRQVVGEYLSHALKPVRGPRP